MTFFFFFFFFVPPGGDARILGSLKEPIIFASKRDKMTTTKLVVYVACIYFSCPPPILIAHGINYFFRHCKTKICDGPRRVNIISTYERASERASVCARSHDPTIPRSDSVT